MKALICLVMVLACVMTAAAADVTGKWAGTITIAGDDGDPHIEPAFLILKQSGTALTGSGGGDESEQQPIQNGKIDGNTITGEVVGTEGSTFKLALTVDGDRITGEVTMTKDGQTQKAKLQVTRLK